MTDFRNRAASVWDTGRASIRHQLKDRYVGATRGDTAALSPAMARRIIATYTDPGDTVLDPHPGGGVVLGEAIRAGRHAIGIASTRRWRSVCETNLDLARLAGAVGTATLFDTVDDPRAAELPGAIDLVLTGIRHTPAGDPHRALARLYDTLDAVADWIWPGGHIVITCRPCRHGGALIDMPGQVREAAEAIGLVQLDHCIALTAPMRGGTVRPRHNPIAAARHTPRIALAAHLDVLVFTVTVRADNTGVTAGTNLVPEIEAVAV